ncbi:unknown [Clostridium sp. CAG:306]|nr:unknown [Clostridium sp. CAG:306]
MVLAHLDNKMALVRNFHRVFDTFFEHIRFHPFERITELFRCFYIKFVVRKTEPVLTFLERVSLNTQKCVVPVCVFFSQIVAVVCDDHFYIKVFGQLDKPGVGHFLFFQPVVLQLDVVIFTKQPFVKLCCLVRSLFVALNKPLCNFTLNTRRKTDKAFVVFFN